MKSDKDHQSLHIGDAIKKLLDQYHLKTKFDETNLLASWERIAGKPVAKHTKKLFIRNKVLFIQLDSPSLKHDFNYSKSQILEVLAKEFGKGVVKEIVVM